MGEIEESGEFEATYGGDKSHDVRYVVHGAKINCTCGSTWGRLIVPKSHGVYLKQKAQLNKKDSRANINVQPMGICSAAIPDEEEPKEKTKVGFWQSVVATVSSLFGKKKEEEIEVDETEIGCLCEPDTDIDWQYTHSEVFIEGEEALLTRSVLKCFKGGTITIQPDGGQEEE